MTRPPHLGWQRAVVTGAATAALPLLWLQLSCNGCSDGESASPDAGVDGEGPDRPILEAGKDADADVQRDADVVDMGPLPDAVPPGWEVWIDWSPKCPLYVPGEGAEMPPPIVWEPCSAAVPSYLSCQRMKDDWSGQGWGIAGFPSFSLDPVTGAALLQFTRIFVDGDIDVSYRLVAEADGVVRNAILKLDTNNNDCGYLVEGLHGSLFAQGIHTKTGAIVDGGPADEWGFLGGPIDERRPKAFRPPDPTRPSGWYISNQWVVQLVDGRHEAWTWDFKQSHIAYAAQGGLPPFKATVIGGDVFSRIGTSNYCGVMSWNLEKGSRPLLLWPGDTTHGAGNFDTDGKDMVWTYSAGPKGCGVDASNPEVWTAPYTTDPDVLAATARRLRKDRGGIGVDPFAVGSGYAMRTVGTGGLLVIRLADGFVTFLNDKPEGTNLRWGDVLGITSEELFVTLYYEEGFAGETIARIRIDSLPFDLPPD